MSALLSRSEFEARLKGVGAERYHNLHPFHRLLHGGKLNKGQVAAWALNRYCYQEAVPRKDAAFMSRVHDREPTAFRPARGDGNGAFAGRNPEGWVGAHF